MLIWDLAPARKTYGVYLIHAITEKHLKFISVNKDDVERNSRLQSSMSSRINGEISAKESVTLANGNNLFIEWLTKKRFNEKVYLEEKGQIPWEDFDNDTVRWYGQHLASDVSDSDIKKIIIERLFDGRDRLTPDEVRQVTLLFGRKDIVKQRLRRELIDCRLRTDVNKRIDERVESADNVLECLKLAIAFFAKHIGIDGTTLEGLSATTGSADYIAMREGLINLFIHQDYNDQSTASQIEISPQRAIFFNAGKSLVGQKSLVEGGKSQSRNPLLSRALRLIGFAELAGSGLRELHRAWRSVRRRPPIIETNPSANNFSLTLDWRVIPELAPIIILRVE